MANMIRLEHGFYTEPRSIKTIYAAGHDKQTGNWWVVIEFNTQGRCSTCLRLPRTIHQIDALAARVNRAKEN